MLGNALISMVNKWVIIIELFFKKLHTITMHYMSIASVTGEVN